MKKMITALLVLGLIAFTSNANAETPTNSGETTRKETAKVNLIGNSIAIIYEYTNIIQCDGYDQADVRVYAEAQYPVASTLQIPSYYFADGNTSKIWDGLKVVIQQGQTTGYGGQCCVMLYDYWVSGVGSDDVYQYYLHYPNN